MAKKTNFTVNDKDYFRVTATVGYKVNGDRIRKTFYGESKKDAENKRDEYISGVKKGLAIDYDKLVFSSAFNEWFNVIHKPSIKDSTYARYEITYRLRISTSDFFTMRLKDVKPIHIQRCLNYISENNSYGIAWDTYKLLNCFFIYCAENSIIDKNIMKGVVLPKETVDKREIKVVKEILTSDEIKKIIDICKEDMRYFIFLFACMTGLREGEIVALTYRDVNNQIVSVNKTAKTNRVYKQDGTFEYQFQVTDPKSKYAFRDVPLTDLVVELLTAHMESEKEKFKRLNIKLTSDTPLFTSEVGTYLNNRNLIRKWEGMCRKLGIEQIKIHGLRKTFCTLLARAGVPLKTAMILMGHSDIKMTAGIYQIVEDDDKKNAILSLQKILV